VSYREWSALPPPHKNDRTASVTWAWNIGGHTIAQVGDNMAVDFALGKSSEQSNVGGG